MTNQEFNIINPEFEEEATKTVEQAWDSDPTAYNVDEAINFVVEGLKGFYSGLKDQTIESNEPLYEVSMVVRENYNNALYHGNLEAASEGDLVENALANLAQNPNLKNRKVKLRLILAKEKYIILIQDEGKGYDPLEVPDALADENLLGKSGRGDLLTEAFGFEKRSEYGTGRTTVMLVKEFGKE